MIGGILFQCLYDTKKREVLAAGGRYDRLIEENRPKVQGKFTGELALYPRSCGFHVRSDWAIQAVARWA